MDPETQKLIERTRQRRMVLNQRMASMSKSTAVKTPDASNLRKPDIADSNARKRQSPVLDRNATAKAIVEINQDDSSKRKCLRDVENGIKRDTPALKSVQSQLKDLATLYNGAALEERRKVCKQDATPIDSGSLGKDSKGEHENIMKFSKNQNLKKEEKNLKSDTTKHMKSVLLSTEEPQSSNANALPQLKLAESSNKAVSSQPPADSQSFQLNQTRQPKNSIGPTTNFVRNSSFRSSKVALNSTPKPFSPFYRDSKISAVKPPVAVKVPALKQFAPLPVIPVMKQSAPSLKQSTPAINHAIPAKKQLTSMMKQFIQPPAPPIISSRELQSYIPDNILGVHETPPESELNKTQDEPTLKPVAQRFAAWAQKTETPKISSAAPSSSKLLFSKMTTLERKITGDTPVGRPSFRSVSSPQVCGSLSMPVASSKLRDPSELPVSQRMSQMVETLSRTPHLNRQPADISSAKDSIASVTDGVSGDSKMNAAEGTLTTSQHKPMSNLIPNNTKACGHGPPIPPPLPDFLTKPVRPVKSFRECIEKKASTMWSKQGVSLPCKSPESESMAAMVSSSRVCFKAKTDEETVVEKCQANLLPSIAAVEQHGSELDEIGAMHDRQEYGILGENSTTPSESVQVNAHDRMKSKHLTAAGHNHQNDTRVETLVDTGGPEVNNRLAVTEAEYESVATKTTNEIYQDIPMIKVAQKSPTSSCCNLLIKKEENTMHQAKVKKVMFKLSSDESEDLSEEYKPYSTTAVLDTSTSDEWEEFKKPEVPKMKVVNQPVHYFDDDFLSDRMSDELDDDDISLKGFVSRSVRREGILPSAPVTSGVDNYDECQQSIDSEDSSNEPSSKYNGYLPDADSSTDDDEGEKEMRSRNNIGDLLDEAMSDTTDDYIPETEIVMRRPQQVHTYDPDMNPDNVQMRKQQHQKTADSKHDNNLRPYSLEAYRKSVNVHQHLMGLSNSDHASHNVETDVSSWSESQRDEKRRVQARIEELKELAQSEENIIVQTSNALKKCCVGNSSFAGSAEQAECNKIWLIACQKRQCYMTEIQRLKETGVLSTDASGPKGSLTISDIRLPLKKDFVTQLGTSQDNTIHYFIVIFKNGPQAICTQMLCTHDPAVRGNLEFEDIVKFRGISADFKVTLDIYSMSVPRENCKDKKKKTPKKKKVKGPDSPYIMKIPSFPQVASLSLTMKSLDKNSFHLDRLTSSSPLHGEVFLRQKCYMEVMVAEKGFLTMFDDVNGFGAWHRRWCVLSGNKLCVWKYPDDETRKDPMFIIDLKRCITETVGLVPRDICARPNTFELVTVRQLLKGEHDTLVTKTYNSTTTFRHQMSADSKEDRIKWCNKINTALDNLRTWNADALKPVKLTYSPLQH